MDQETIKMTEELEEEIYFDDKIIRTIMQRTDLNAWRDQIKNNKPFGATNAQIDQLFINYTPLQ